MEIRQLKYFVCVAETNSFSEASRRCFLSQSAISQQIRALEEELNVTLFIRNPHKVILTEAGEELLPMARLALKTFNECHEHIINMNGQLCGNLNIGMTPFIEPYVRQAAALMLKQYPNVRLNLHYLPTLDLHRMLLDHKLDMAFTINTSNPDEGIESTQAMSIRICAIMNKQHPLAGKEKVTFDELLGHSIIMPETSPRIYNTVRKHLDVDIESLNIRTMVNDLMAVLNLVRETNFITFLPDKAIHGISNMVAKEIVGLEIPMQSYVHKLKDSYTKRSAEVFMQLMREYSIPLNNSFD